MTLVRKRASSTVTGSPPPGAPEGVNRGKLLDLDPRVPTSMKVPVDTWPIPGFRTENRSTIGSPAGTKYRTHATTDRVSSRHSARPAPGHSPEDGHCCGARRASPVPGVRVRVWTPPSGGGTQGDERIDGRPQQPRDGDGVEGGEGEVGGDCHRDVVGSKGVRAALLDARCRKVNAEDVERRRVPGLGTRHPDKHPLQVLVHHRGGRVVPGGADRDWGGRLEALWV
eukprot:CAMPEP_0172074012 /NCGR_PEP_ID=MMETSP1043-20130122/15175_1 /TAXON_ID=464988 /ORGANISM="Hemiselmis andersenii, Strain CCMP441" /LENGTH=225 /DNA_ID=CAMNT_0012734625 /DNA_START=70 /DNA_END=748 /DNA_ORIENTATION=+